MSDLTVDAGELRHSVIFQSPVSSTVDAMGSQVNTWTPIFSGVRAKIRTLTGNQLLAAQQMASGVQLVVETRYHAGVCPKWRILFGSRIFLIEYVNNVDFRNVKLLCYCKEIFEAGS